MKMQFANINGADLILFWDENGSECSIQSENRADGNLVWLGVNIDPKGQRAFRMLLDRNKVGILCELFKNFLSTGQIPNKPENMPSTIQNKS